MKSYKAAELYLRPHSVLRSSRKLVKHLASICVRDDEKVGHSLMRYTVLHQVHLAFTLKELDFLGVRWGAWVSRTMIYWQRH